MCLKKVNEGFHLFTREYEASYVSEKFETGVIFECEIPIGSYYFMEDGRTQICTNQFRFIKEI